MKKIRDIRKETSTPLMPLNYYRILLFTTAALLFLFSLKELSFPSAYYYFLSVLVTGLALYSAWRLRSTSVFTVGGLLFLVLFFLAIPYYEPSEPTSGIAVLASAATFLRLGINAGTTVEEVEKRR